MGNLFSPPKVPDSAQVLQNAQNVASGQEKYNVKAGTQSQAGSMVNQDTGQGWNLNYVKTGTGPGGVPIYTAKQTMTPENKALYDLLMGTKATAGTQAGDVLAGANYGAAPISDVVGNATSGLVGDMMSRWGVANQPFMETARNQLDTKLKNQGLRPGNEAYDNAMRALDTSQTNAVTGATTQFMPQAFNQAFQMYNNPAELSAKLAALGMPTDPKYAAAPGLNIQPANLTGAYATSSDAATKQYEAEAKQYADMWKSIGQLGGAALGGGMGGWGSLASSLFSTPGNYGGSPATNPLLRPLA